MQTEKETYTLGLDVGMASVGAALLSGDRILALHVRTFDKAETAKEGESINKIRRDARLVRRRIRRRAHRLLRLVRLIKRQGLVTVPSPLEFALPGVSPWELRAEGLDRKLEPKEWAAVLYHLVKHRGFQSNRKSEAKADEKVGQMLSGVSANHSLLQASGLRTIGELVSRHERFREAKRNKGGDYTHTVARADLERELRALFNHQRGLGNPAASEDFELAVHSLLMARRPTLSGVDLLKMVGRCTFEKSEFRAPKASYRAERFVWLGKLNNLKIVGDGDARSLTDTERRALLELPFKLNKVSFKQARKALDLQPHHRFNLLSYRVNPKAEEKDPESANLFEAKAFHALRKAYAEAGLEQEWLRDAIDPDHLDTLGYALTCFKDDRESRAYLTERGIKPEVIEAVLGESFDKFIHLSQKALKAILPHMEGGLRYDRAAELAGYNHSKPQGIPLRTSRLPAPDPESIRNPVVYRALNQARKLVNAIIQEYGPPAAVNIELARDLSKPYDERRRIMRDQKEYQTEKERAREEFQDQFGHEPKGIDLQKFRLYREQGGQCAYSQKALDVGRLFQAGYAEIDHALPFSRSYDNSQNNKVLVLTAENRNKGNRTPYEFFDGASDSERWQRFVAWVHSTKAIRQAKRNRLLRIHFGEEEASEFRDRNLNDTRYICREFKRMIETHLQWHPSATGDERCVVLSGQLTSLLRARWGLIKHREGGDLHHAMDAAVIAAANRSLVKRMSDYSRRRELAHVRDRYIDPETGEILDISRVRQFEEDFPKPWANFRRELLGWLSPNPAEALAEVYGKENPRLSEIRPIRVSRAPTRRGLGAAHQEYIRSVGKEGKLLRKGLAALRVSVNELRVADIERIVGRQDPRNAKWIAALFARLKPHQAEDKKIGKCAGAKAFAKDQPPLRKPSKDPDKAPIIRSVKLLDTQVSGLPVRGGIANNGAMLRTDIFTQNGRFFAVPVYVADAVRVDLPNRAVIASKPEREWQILDESHQFLFSLYPNDWLAVKLKGDIKEGYFAGLDRSTGAISLWLHDRNQSVGKDGQWRGVGIKTALAVEKCHVDTLGRLYRVRNEKRQPIRLR